MNVERELQELREQLAQVQEWKARHDEIEEELAKVWVDGGDVLPAVEADVNASEGEGPLSEI